MFKTHTISNSPQSSSKPSSGKNVVNSTTLDNISEAQTDYIYDAQPEPNAAAPHFTHHAASVAPAAQPSDTTLLLAHSVSQEPVAAFAAAAHTSLEEGLRRVGFEEHSADDHDDGPSDDGGDFENQENREPQKLHRR